MCVVVFAEKREEKRREEKRKGKREAAQHRREAMMIATTLTASYLGMLSRPFSDDSLGTQCVSYSFRQHFVQK